MSSPELMSDFGVAEPAGAACDEVHRAVLWDLPLRVFHWSLVAAVTVAIVTGELGGAWMPWHGRAGLVIVGLLVFRLLWGVLGSATSRFTQFAPTPARLRAYLRGRWRGVGHNPLGALSVWAFMLLLSAQVATGLVADDDIATTGPLNGHVSSHLARAASGWHAGWGADLVFALIALHLAAVAWYTLRRRAPLVRAMWNGDKPLPPRTPASRDGAGPRVLALTLFALACTGVWAMLRWAA